MEKLNEDQDAVDQIQPNIKDQKSMPVKPPAKKSAKVGPQKVERSKTVEAGQAQKASGQTQGKRRRGGRAKSVDADVASDDESDKGTKILTFDRSVVKIKGDKWVKGK